MMGLGEIIWDSWRQTRRRRRCARGGFSLPVTLGLLFLLGLVQPLLCVAHCELISLAALLSPAPASVAAAPAGHHHAPPVPSAAEPAGSSLGAVPVGCSLLMSTPATGTPPLSIPPPFYSMLLLDLPLLILAGWLMQRRPSRPGRPRPLFFPPPDRPPIFTTA
jgi:hypothetical protein